MDSAATCDSALPAGHRSRSHLTTTAQGRTSTLDASTFQFGTLTLVALLLLFYGGTFYISTRIGKREENADGYMTAGNKVGFGISAASMTATWIWASSHHSQNSTRRRAPAR